MIHEGKNRLGESTFIGVNQKNQELAGTTSFSFDIREEGTTAGKKRRLMEGPPEEWGKIKSKRRVLLGGPAKG